MSDRRIDTKQMRDVVETYEMSHFGDMYQRDVDLAGHAQWMLLSASNELDEVRSSLATSTALAADQAKEIERLKCDEATMKLSRMLGLGDPVRPDIHAKVVRQRDEAVTERDELLAVIASTAEQLVGYGITASPPVTLAHSAAVAVDSHRWMTERRDEWKAKADQAAATEREQIAAWLANWEPDYYADAADNEAMSIDAVVLLAADRVRAGAYKPEQGT